MGKASLALILCITLIAIAMYTLTVCRHEEFGEEVLAFGDKAPPPDETLQVYMKIV